MRKGSSDRKIRRRKLGQEVWTEIQTGSFRKLRNKFQVGISNGEYRQEFFRGNLEGTSKQDALL